MDARVSVDNTKLADWEAMQRLHGRQSLINSDGGGTSGGGMEARLAKLEAQTEHLQADMAKLASVPTDIATIKVEMVTKDYLHQVLNEAFDKHLRWTLGIVGAMLTLATAIIKAT